MPGDPSQMGADGTPCGKGASAAAAAKELKSLAAAADPAGSTIAPLLLKSGKQTKKTVKLSWKKRKAAASYVVFGGKSGKKRLSRIGTTTGATFTESKLASGKRLSKATYYKFCIVALDAKDNVVSTSKAIYVATGGKRKAAANPQKVKIAKPTLKKARSLHRGTKLKLGAKIVKAKNAKVVRKARMRYESSAPAITFVTKKGVVKAKKKGTAKIYCYAQNGKVKALTVTVV